MEKSKVNSFVIIYRANMGQNEYGPSGCRPTIIGYKYSKNGKRLYSMCDYCHTMHRVTRKSIKKYDK